MRPHPLATLFLGLILLAAPASAQDPQAQWPQFRGPEGTGYAPMADPPEKWSETENVAWKIALPGVGHSSPIVWGDTVFVTYALETEQSGDGGPTEKTPPRRRRGPPSKGTDKVHEFVLAAYRVNDGSLVWKQTCLRLVPHERTHADGSWASNSPVTDGEKVFAYFGSRGLFCFDLAGKRLWDRETVRMSKKMSFGEGASPGLYKNRIVILQDHEGASKLSVFDTETGKTVWEIDRDEPSSWSTPIVVTVNGKPQIVTSATRAMRGHDLETGELVWHCSGMTGNVIPTPIHRDGRAYFMSGFRGHSQMALDLNKARGDADKAGAVLWRKSSNAPYTPSHGLFDGHLYYLRTNGAILSCCKADTGESVYEAERFRDMGTVYASVVGAKDRFYLVGKRGDGVVIRTGAGAELIARNHLDDAFTATPALAGRRLILRGEKALYCIVKPAKSDEEGF